MTDVHDQVLLARTTLATDAASACSDYRPCREDSDCPPQVLLVDDEAVSSLILDNICRHLGAECHSVSNGQEALYQLAHGHFELVLLDRSMPGMDGFEVLRRIREGHSEAELPVVMVTAHNDRESVIASFNCGANDYLTKPFDAGTSSARIRTHLRLQNIQKKLKESQQRFALAVRGTNDGIWDWDLPAESIYYSPRWQAMLGLPDQECVRQPDHWFARIHEDDRRRVHESLNAHLAGESDYFECELRMLHEGGAYRWMLCRGQAVIDSSGSPIRMAGSLTDVTEGKSADALTGLPNRVLFKERLAQRFHRYCRDRSQGFGVIFLDLDDFKIVNDRFGHAAGDELLVAIARTLESVVRKSDSALARLGGDEFAILVDHVASDRDGAAIAQRLVDVTSKPVLLQDRHCITPSASIGIALARPGTGSADDLIRAADTAMYYAKRDGKNSFRAFAEEMQQDRDPQAASQT